MKVRPDTRRWQAAVEEHVRANGFDAVVESALADAAEFRTSSSSYRQAAHRIEMVALATAEALSQLGLVDRFLSGDDRYVSWENHDVCAREMLATLAVIEAEHLADRITVVRRDGTVLYDNELIDGSWRRRPAAQKAVKYEHGRPWTARETAVFRRGLARTDQRLHRDFQCEDRRLVVQRDVERAAAPAEPVRRIAQARRTAPGVDYHRLSTAEHRWVFDELIAPSYLSGIVSRVDPRAVYVLGQPGAGKLLAARMVKRAMRPGTTQEAIGNPRRDAADAREQDEARVRQAEYKAQVQRAAQEKAAAKAAEREARRPVCTGCGTKFTDERWEATQATDWDTPRGSHPALCDACKQRAVAAGGGHVGTQERREPARGGAARLPACCAPSCLHQLRSHVHRRTVEGDRPRRLGVTPEPRPSLCGDCDRRFVTDVQEPWSDEPPHQGQEQEQAVPAQKTGRWFSRRT
ncbi:zeta toxin family protein [Streptomyces sp. MS1.HAVA.3]|uniref:UDP-N-acetylglucosamine kinase n=1 Tax=Streptomyces caledonius TaxID=3134107 RepID=A0ABU8TX76_9ACTN